MKTLIAALLCLPLAACGLLPKEEVRIEVVEVPKPVFIPCAVIPPAPPVFSSTRITADKNIFEITQLLLADIEERKGYELKLKAASAGCVQQEAPQPTGGKSP